MQKRLRADIYQLLPYFHKIIVTAAYTNVKSVASLLTYFRFDKEEKLAYLAAFKENKQKYAHWCMDVNKRTVVLLANCEEPNMNSLIDVSGADDKSLMLSMLGELEHSGKATAVFNLIFRHLKKRVNTDDFTVKLKSAKTGKDVTVSLVEYLDSLTTTKGTRDKTLIQFHKYLSKFVHIPSCFVLNKNYVTK